MKWVAAIAIAFVSVPGSAGEPELQKLISPSIKGRTLYISGKIDSHIYDFLARETKALQNVDVIELNSLGGNALWAVDIGKKMATLKKVTHLSSGHVCASACVYLFAAGVKREADAGTWLGIHGVRLGGGYAMDFKSACMSGGDSTGCKTFTDHWYAVTRAATDEAFQDMEANGVSPKLREDYYNLPDLSRVEWILELNVLRKPDWELNVEDAVPYGLVTRVRKASGM